METIGKREVGYTDVTRTTKQNEKEAVFKTLQKHSTEIIDEYLELPKEKIEELKFILTLRHPTTGIEPSAVEMKIFLCDLPFFLLAVQSQFLIIKHKKEQLAEQLEKEEFRQGYSAEKKLRQERLKEKEEGLRKELGAITSNQIKAGMYRNKEEYNSIETMKEEVRNFDYVEKMLEKTVWAIEHRRYEIGKMIEIEMKGM